MLLQENDYVLLKRFGVHKKDCPHQAVFCMQIGYFCGTGVPVGTTVLAVMYFAAA